MDGVLPIYKPTGITSYDVIRRIKTLLPRGQKIGHAGTLDPFAEGVLIILLGKATKRFAEIQNWKKTYRAVAILKASSDTLDSEGKIVQQIDKDRIFAFHKSELQKVADKFVGEILQAVPQFSAAKYKGKSLYKYARKGEKIPPKSKKVTVYAIKVEEVGDDKVTMLVKCASGTYIRQLTYDIMLTLGIESYLEKLTRIKVGEIGISDCQKLTDSLDMEGLKE